MPFRRTFKIAAEWKPELEVLAKELGYSTTSATEIESRFGVFVDLLAKPRRTDRQLHLHGGGIPDASRSAPRTTCLRPQGTHRSSGHLSATARELAGVLPRNYSSSVNFDAGRSSASGTASFARCASIWRPWGERPYTAWTGTARCRPRNRPFRPHDRCYEDLPLRLRASDLLPPIPRWLPLRMV
jgi:hypothetical protein